MPMGEGTEDVRLGLNRPAAVVPLDPEQALGTWQRLGITFDLFTPRTVSRADCVAGWSPGHWPARARCS